MTTYLSYPAATPSGPAPDYTPQDIELARLDSTSPSILSAPPPYGEVTSSSFHPTVHLQIETPGKPWFCLPLPPRPDPIPVFTLSSSDSDASAASTSTATAPTFISLRPERSSGSCYLTSPSNTPNDPSTVSPLATTTYRFGPNRPARMRLFSPHAAPMSTAALHTLLFSKDSNTDTPHSEPPLPEVEEHEPLEPWDSFPLTSPALLTRTLAFRTRLGTFEWRYASRRERHALSRARGGEDVSSLLVLERVVRVATAQNQNNNHPSSASASKSGEEQIRTPVAHFVRGRGTRTEGSGASSAGNGGRLDVDLRMWEHHHHRHGGGDDDDGDGDDDQADKVEREMAVVLVVATCLVMLKREVDRRRAQKFAIIAMAVS